MTTWPRQPDSRTCGPSCVVVAEGLPGPWPDFDARVLAMHRRLNRVWPRALGTTPWAIARKLGGRRVRRYRTAEVLDALPRPVPVYLGSRWLPRHVVLVLDERDGEPVAYDPARGVLAPIGTSGWKHTWWAILPAPKRVS
ncbi:hypothetical protein GON03_06490 [Nocardioides sp. MAH-18]|uniref:Peptidase C39 domain-containing protein n=1 Tax=Nocardioides agri TaxID=2682843 RepID=A0A6L6XT62_9ACTN|nr:MULTISPECIES: hypothetical protein [unclassified Nocardioides]MBA2953963.1 hypothetical protein [Nocardioides sp. CGMCC 1.13656]MVQ48825.1 hypothetical protein [Nocardioides sp. MAH-18]